MHMTIIAEKTLSFAVFILMLLNIDSIYKFHKETSGNYLQDNTTRQNTMEMIMESFENKKDYKAITEFYGIHIPIKKFHDMVKKIIPCVESYPIIMNNETNKASGYVLPYYSRKNIYINNNHWPMLDIYSKSRLIVHECTHLTLDTDDYAYDYQDKLFSLRGSHALHNADTITSIICALSYYNKH